MKSYKDLSREAVLNAPDGAMWAAIEQRDFKLRCFYKIQNKKLRVYADEWSDSSYGDIISAQNGERIYFIPLPNVKIPWESTQDSVSPVPKGTRMLLELAYGGAEECNEPELRYWNKLGNWVTDYKIIDPDYIREESSELVGSSESVQLVGQSIISDSELLRKLKLLNHIGEQFPLIADCAKAAMERLVEKWVVN